MRKIYIIFVTVGVLSGCSLAPESPPPTVTLRNETGVSLTNIVLWGQGFRDSVGTLASGVSTQITIHPGAGLNLRLSLDYAAPGHRVTRENLATLIGADGRSFD